MRRQTAKISIGAFLWAAFSLLMIPAAVQSANQELPVIRVSQWITDNPPQLDNLRGQVYVLEFWATWCPPCRKMIPHMVELDRKYREQGLVIVALSQDKSAESVKAFVQKNGITYNVAMDDATSTSFSIKGIPTAVVINHRGKPVWQGYPWQSEFEEAIRQSLSDAESAKRTANSKSRV